MFFGEGDWKAWGLSGLTGGCGPSALRWMAARAEFPCGLTGGGGASALRWMLGGVWGGIGVLLDACAFGEVEKNMAWVGWPCYNGYD